LFVIALNLTSDPAIPYAENSTHVPHGKSNTCYERCHLLQANEPLVRSSVARTTTSTPSSLSSSSSSSSSLSSLSSTEPPETALNASSERHASDWSSSIHLTPESTGSDLLDPWSRSTVTSLDSNSLEPETEDESSEVSPQSPTTIEQSSVTSKGDQCSSISTVVANVRATMESRQVGSVARLWPIPPPDPFDQVDSLRSAGRERRHQSEFDPIDHVNTPDRGISAVTRDRSNGPESNSSIWTLTLDSSDVQSTRNRSPKVHTDRPDDNSSTVTGEEGDWLEIDNSSVVLSHSKSSTSSSSSSSFSRSSSSSFLDRRSNTRNLSKRRIESPEPDDAEPTDDDPIDEPDDDELEQTISTTSTSSPVWYTSGGRSASSAQIGDTRNGQAASWTARAMSTQTNDRKRVSTVTARTALDQDEELVYLAQLMPDDRLTQRSRTRFGPH
jgi:hypothetical protein